MKNQKKYRAFSLIELMISIVILGIIMVTIPMFLKTFVNSSKVSVKEEVFFNQFSLLSLITTKYFDQNSTVGDNYYKDLNATGGDTELIIKKFADGSLNRTGKEQMNNNILRSGSSYTLSTIGPDAGESGVSSYNDIDDFDGYTQHINVGVESNGYNIAVSVNYINDDTNYSDNNISFDMNYTALSKSAKTNIKLITVKTTFSDGSVVRLYYPACNIGGSKIFSLEEIRR